MMDLTKTLQKKFDLFCSLCNLHGLCYLRSDVKLPVCDRVFWITVFISSFLGSCLVIYNLWQDWLNNPFVIVYDSNVLPIWEVPFPSVTICNFVTIKRSALDLQIVNHTESLLFSSLVCTNKDHFKNRKLDLAHEDMNYFFDFLHKVSPTCEEVLRHCYWEGRAFNCCQIFQPIITNIGLCYIINSLPSSMLFKKNIAPEFIFNNSYPEDSLFWSPEDGYPVTLVDRTSEQPQNIFPKWAISTGYESGLGLEIEQNLTEWQEQCSGGFSGFKVIINSPQEGTGSSQAALRVPMRRDFQIELMPRTVRTSSELSSVLPLQRGCYFQGEKSLELFSIYSQSNCIYECILNATLSRCKCAPFYLPRNTSTPVCSNSSEIKCYQQVEDWMVDRNIERNNDYKEDQSLLYCGCYPPCNEVSYDHIANHAIFIKNNTDDSSRFPQGRGYAKVTIFYKENAFLGIHRQPQITLYDFLGTCGGLLGLFMGFSCISAIEVVYHLFLRPLLITTVSYITTRTKAKKKTLQGFNNHYYN